ncbi:hypothetical protein [Catalinimonas niigatensis]|uniref:hypothetical protein n=1 Tax=Catalinimonas niigatensis TaxID=1397264 RepID=UPI0026652F6E|nr:hypothetical protein [Catalinimonas niigatensis]WPP48383.1 hypothetical protein PZB72_17050 [Catalinimonas niigatensis]
MLDLEKINTTLTHAIKDKFGSQRAFAEAHNLHKSDISRDKTEGKLESLNRLNRYAEMIGVSIEELVLPGLTEAAQYVNHSNFDQSRGKHSKVSGFATDQHQAPILNKSADPELQQKLYESQENRISLLEQISSLKDEINALKIELNNCKNAL